MVWRFDGAAGPLNFFGVDSLAKTEFVAPPGRSTSSTSNHVC
jgi:hypothetical protein